MYIFFENFNSRFLSLPLSLFLLSYKLSHLLPLLSWMTDITNSSEFVSLNTEVNRISGPVPPLPAYTEQVTLNVLTGNIFDCASIGR